MSPTCPLFRRSHRLILLLTLALLALWWPREAQALDDLEITALMALRISVPHFGLNPSHTSSKTITTPPEPRVAWPTTREGWLRICADSDGPNVHGLTCGNGHIVAMNCSFFELWPNTPIGDLSPLAGLTHLKEFYSDERQCWEFDHTGICAPNNGTIAKDEIMYKVLSTPEIALERFYLASWKWWPRDLVALARVRTALERHTSLKYLHIGVPFDDGVPLNASGLPNLKAFEWRGPSPTNFSYVAPYLPRADVNPAPLTLVVRDCNMTDMNQLPPYVEGIHVEDPPSDTFPLSTPPHIRTLYIHYTRTISGNWNFSWAVDVQDLSVLADFYVATISIIDLPRNLVNFSCTGCAFDASFDTLPSGTLQRLSVTSPALPSTTTLPYLPPSLQDCVNLRVLQLGKIDPSVTIPWLNNTWQLHTLSLSGDAPNIQDILFSIPRSSLQHLSLTGATLPALPERFDLAFPNLVTLSLTLCKLSPLATQFQLNFPIMRTFILDRVEAVNVGDNVANWNFGIMRSLETIEVVSSAAFSLPGFNFSSLAPSLRSLALTTPSLSGTIPIDFFKTHPLLEDVTIRDSQLGGTIPGTGWTKLRFLTLNNNTFTHWPSVTGGAPKLQEISIELNRLVEIPGDDSFNEMPALRLLSLRETSLTGQIPRFWGNHPLIESVKIVNTLLGGHLPDIYSQNLKDVEIFRYTIDGPGLVCGPLPEVPVDVSIATFDLNNNMLTGPVPESWKNHLHIWRALDLTNNNLSGTLPNPLLAGAAPLGISISLMHNVHIEGPVPRVIAFDELPFMESLQFMMQNTSLDVCSNPNPLAPSTTPAECEFPSAAAPCDCPGLWTWTFCDGASKCNNSVFASPLPSPATYPIPDRCPLPPIFVRQSFVVTDSVTVVGDLSIAPGEAIVFSGLFTLNVTGCLSVDRVVMELDKKSIDKLEDEKEFPAITFSKGLCPNANPNPSITVKKKTSTCKKVKADSKMTSHTLLAVFDVNPTPCRLWWIIVASVLGFVLASATVIGVVLAVVCPRVAGRAAYTKKKLTNPAQQTTKTGGA